MKVTILGAGAYGLALATMAKINEHNITIWSRNQVELDELEQKHTNKRVLPNYILPNGIEYTNNLRKSVKNSDLIIFAVPAGAVDEVSKNLKKYYKEWTVDYIAAIVQYVCSALYYGIALPLSSRKMGTICIE